MFDQRYYFNYNIGLIDIQEQFGNKKSKLPNCPGLSISLSCSCVNSLFAQPFGSGLCFSTCPTGYSQNSGTCIGIDQVIADFVLDAVAAKITFQAITAINGETTAYFPPTFELSDPIPSNNRGYYFDGQQYIQLPPNSLCSGSALILSTSLTISAWVRPSGSGVRTIYSKKSGSVDTLTIRVNVDDKIEFVGGSSLKSIVSSTALAQDVWTFVALTFEYSSTTDITTVTYYSDGVQDRISNSEHFYIKDNDVSALQKIGAAADLHDMYVGFIWRVTLRNYVYDSIASEFTSSGCPTYQTECLSRCPFLQSPNCGGCTANCDLCTDFYCSSCAPGFVLSPDRTQCIQCPPLCSLCLPSLQCLSCTPPALFSASLCECPVSYYLAYPEIACLPCHPSCKACQAAGEFACTDCNDFAMLTRLPLGACECVREAFVLTIGVCKMCDVQCASCLSGGTGGCLGCRQGARLMGSAPNFCICEQGYFPDPDPSLCRKCDFRCTQCNSAFTCTSCSENAQLIEGVCLCKQGFIPEEDTGLCVVCPPDTFLNLQNQCEPLKPELPPPTPFLTISLSNSLSVVFDHPMNCLLSSSDVFIAIKIPSNLEFEFIWLTPNFTDPHTLHIPLQFQSTYLPDNSIMTFIFLHPEIVVDEENTPIVTDTLTGKMNAFGTPAAPESSLVNTQVGRQAAAVSKSGVSAGVATSFLNGNPAGFISLVNQLQLTSYISMTKIQLSSDFAATLAAINVEQMLPNPLSDYSLVEFHEDESQLTDKHVNNYGIESTLFLSNSLGILVTSGLVLLSYVPIYVLSKVKIKFVASYFEKMLPSLKWTTPLQMWMTSYLDLGVLSFLQLSNVRNSFGGLVPGFSCCVAVCTTLLFVLTPIWVGYFLIRNFNLISSRSDPAFNRLWGSLFLSFKSSPNLSTVAFFFLFTVRRLVLATTLICLQDYPQAIALSNTALCIIVSCTQSAIYTLKCRPYADLIDQTDSISTECSTLLVYVCASVFVLDVPTSMKDIAGAMGVWVVRSAIVSNLGLSVWRTGRMVKELLQVYRERMIRVEAKYKVNTEKGGEEEKNELSITTASR